MTWDLPYDFINRTPARYGLYDSTISGSISTLLTVDKPEYPPTTHGFGSSRMQDLKETSTESYANSSLFI